MADEELRISVKVDQEKAAENTRLLKDSFRSITDIQHVQRFEALGRQFQLTDTQLKQLGTAILKPNDALSGFAAGFGRAGTILLAFDAAVAVAKAITTTFSDAASRQLDISNAAKRMGNIHAAQLDANVHAMERERIERGRGIAMMENFSRRRAEFLEHSSQFRRSIMEDVEGPFADVVRRHFAELEQETDPTKMMNLVRRFSDEIEKYYRERGKPGDAERGAQKKREYLERWFGLPDIAQLTTDFLKVSKEAEEAWEKNQKAAEEFWRVTTDISDNFSKIVSSVLTQTMDDLGIGAVLRVVNAFLERGVKEHDEIGAMSPEERQKYIDSLVKEGDAAWRKAIIDFLVNSSPASHNFPRPGGRPGEAQPQRLLEDLNDKQTDLIAEEKRLVENLQFLNAILSGESGIGGQKPTFHNAPQGGAEGESNPVQIPDDAAQPGGGAAAEARGRGRAAAGMRSKAKADVDPFAYLTAPQGPTDFSGRLAAAATANPLAALGAQRAGERVYTYGQLATGLPLPGVSEARATVAREDIGETHGISFPRGATPSAFVQTDPELNPHITTTLAHELGHVGRRQVAEAQTNIFKQYLYGTQPGQQRLGKGAEENIQRFQDVRNAEALYKAGAIGRREYLESKLDAEAMKEKMSPAEAADIQRHLNLQETEATRLMAPGGRFDLPAPSGGERASGGRPSDRSGMAREAIGGDLDAGRRRLDRDMGDELDVSGRLNVAVDAPAGTEVKAAGSGMFANNVTVDRRMGFEE